MPFNRYRPPGIISALIAQDKARPLEEFEVYGLCAALALHRGNQTKAAEDCGISRQAMRDKVIKHKLDMDKFKYGEVVRYQPWDLPEEAHMPGQPLHPLYEALAMVRSRTVQPVQVTTEVTDPHAGLTWEPINGQWMTDDEYYEFESASYDHEEEAPADDDAERAAKIAAFKLLNPEEEEN